MSQFLGRFQGSGGGGAGLTVDRLQVLEGTTGVVAQLLSSIGGSLVFSRLAGPNVTVAADGAVSFGTSLPSGQTRALTARVQNGTGDAAERAFVFQGVAAAPPPSPTLGALTLSGSLTEGDAGTLDIVGATAGSALALQAGALPAGMALNSAARTIAGTPSAAGAASFTLRETLVGATNSPRDTALNVTVAAAAGEVLAGPWTANSIRSTTFGSSSHVPQGGDVAPDTITIIMSQAVSSGAGLVTNLAVSGRNISGVYADLTAASAAVKAGSIMMLGGGNLVTDDDNPFTAAQFWRDGQDLQAARPGANARFLHETTFRAVSGRMAGSGHHREAAFRVLERDGRYVVDWQQVLRYVAQTRAYSEWSDITAPAFTAGELDLIRDLDELPASFKVDSVHGNVNWRLLVAPQVHLRWLEAQNNGTPALPFGYRLYSRVDSNVVAGGRVGTIPSEGGRLSDGVTPRANKWAGCTVSLVVPNGDFALAIEGNELVVNRVTAGRLAAGVTTLWIRIAKTGCLTRVYPIEVILETPPAVRTATRFETSADLPDQAVDTSISAHSITILDHRTGPWLARRHYTGTPRFIPASTTRFSMVFDAEWLGTLATASEQWLLGIGPPGATANTATIRVRKNATRALSFRALDSAGANYGVAEYLSTKLFVAGQRALGFISMRVDTAPVIQVGIADSAGTTISTFTPTNTNPIRSADLEAFVALSGRVWGGATGQTYRPTKARFGGMWASIGGFIDFADPANRALFGTEVTGTMTLASDDGVVAGITPQLWLPPWYGPGDIYSGRNQGTFGDLVCSRQGRLA